jgi:hypothetical protein
MILLIGAWAGSSCRSSNTAVEHDDTVTVLSGANADLIQGFITVPIQQAVAGAEDRHAGRDVDQM